MRFRNRQTKFCMLLIGELPPTQIRCHLCKRYFYVSHLDSAELCCFSKFCSCAKWDLFNKFYCPECIKVKFTVELEQHFVSNQLWDRRHLIPGSICGQKLLTELVIFTKRNWKEVQMIKYIILLSSVFKSATPMSVTDVALYRRNHTFFANISNRFYHQLEMTKDFEKH